MHPIIYTLIVTHITIAAVTMFLHRSQAHQSVIFHPIVNHFFRLWLWLTTGMVTKEWVAIHRKHHAKCETQDDPHSPVYQGVWNILFFGVYFYQKEAKNQETLEVYGLGTPDDWLERKIYASHPMIGIMIMLAINCYLFGLSGLAIWVIQMIWIPFWAAGVINGIGHWFGYRTFASADTSTNIFPIGIIIGGEEFHNNHHAFPRSARLSYKPWEFDIGWFYINALQKVGLARIDSVSPKHQKDFEEFSFSHNLSLFANKMSSIRMYEKLVLSKEVKEQISSVRARVKISCNNLIGLVTIHKSIIQPFEKEKLKEVLSINERLRLVHKMKEDLEDVWHGAGISISERYIKIKEWCKKAEDTGHSSLIAFANYLKSKIDSKHKAA